tara:strand:- start:2244 stop:2819 length:576 start_codon:yes stop_codon:yes gene_type:complete
MALTDLELKLQVCVTTSCTTLALKDTVGVYSATNTGGWGASTVNPADVDTASLEITDPAGTITTVDVTTLVAALVITGDDSLGNYLNYTVDGEYKIKLTLTVGGDTKNFYLCNYLLCKVRCCVDTLWSNFASDTVSSDCGCTSSTLQHKALNAEAIFKALCAAAACSNTTTRNALLLKLQRVCNLEKCNCN